MIARLCVRGVGVWSSADKPAAALLPARMRGRASPLTLLFAEVVEQAARAASVDPARMPSVFGSAYGEMNTTATLFSQLWAADAQLSPAKFQASVHNTAAAQLSIALHNPAFTTSIAAGYDTVAMSLLEAAAWLARHGGQVLVACAEEPPTPSLQPGAAYPALAAAFVLDSVEAAGLFCIELIAPSVEAVDTNSSFAPLTESPVSSAILLAQALLGRESGLGLGHVYGAEQGEAVTISLNSAEPRGYRVVVKTGDGRAMGKQRQHE